MSRGSAAVDLDLLADYTAGLLTGAAAADVARLIRTDPDWSTAYIGLVAADQAVRHDLRDLARSRVEPMPGAVVARLEAALGDAGRPTTRAAHARQVTPLAAVRARRRRLAGLATAAAAVLAVAGGVWVADDIVGSQRAADDAATAEDLRERAGGGQVPPAAGPDTAGLPAVVASGTHYRRDTLGRLASGLPAAPGATSDGALAPGGPSAPAAGRMPTLDAELTGPLGRLTDPAALRSCLNAVTTTRPGTVTVVDFARLDGAPALVILVRASTGGTTVVAVGSDCGLGGGVDERAAAPVG